MAQVELECYLLGIADGHVVVEEGASHRFAPTWTAPLDAERSPQEVLAAGAPVVLAAAPHSTSWRWAEGHLTLTFASCADPDAPLHRPRPVPVYRSGDRDVTPESVVGHAVRHVAFLLVTDASFDPPHVERWRSATAEHLPDVFHGWSGT